MRMNMMKGHLVHQNVIQTQVGDLFVIIHNNHFCELFGFAVLKKFQLT